MQLRHAAVCAALLSLVAAAASAQQPAMIYGDTLDERALALVEASDSGYCLAGWTRSYGYNAPAFSNILVVKTNPAAVPQWSLVSAGTDDEEANSLARTRDGGYAFCGWTRSYGPGIPSANALVVKLTAAGARQWAWAFGGAADDRAFSVVQTKDSGYALVGYTYTYGPPPYPNIMVVRLNPIGLPMWAKAYWCNPHLGEDEGYSIIQTVDGGYAVAGRAKIRASADFDAFVLKLDPMGNVMWMNFVPGDAADEAYSVAEDQQANVMAAGWTLSYGTNPMVRTDIFVLQCTQSGVPIWQSTYGWAADDEQVLDDRSLVTTFDGGSALCGPTRSVGPGAPNPNLLLLKLTPAGAIQWAHSHPSQNYPGSASDVPYPLIQLAAGGYAAAGWTNSFAFLGGDDFQFASFGPNGSRVICTDSQFPIQDTLRVDGGQMRDTTFMYDWDSLPLQSETVSYHAICDTTVGVGEQPDRAASTSGVRLVVDGGISLELAHAAHVDIRLYAIDGQRITVLVHGRLREGVNRLRLPASTAPGVYIVCGRVDSAPVSFKILKL
ncbi:hypothetical protein FJY68_11685 [candidate division WOR-3 bacterium]|uniref:T9SS type A sorting domain-containing protein n=1 Tax=candidate division WOR-3 bacterium TaxID=2052148 RepID=A0A938BUY7_UNCW3|nr:hypothetical protein [candidate division WOR-3 bacterium]